MARPRSSVFVPSRWHSPVTVRLLVGNGKPAGTTATGRPCGVERGCRWGMAPFVVGVGLMHWFSVRDDVLRRRPA